MVLVVFQQVSCLNSIQKSSYFRQVPTFLPNMLNDPPENQRFESTVFKKKTAESADEIPFSSQVPLQIPTPSVRVGFTHHALQQKAPPPPRAGSARRSSG